MQEIKLDGKGTARGRNGLFVPRVAYVVEGVEVAAGACIGVEVALVSRRSGEGFPIRFDLSNGDAAKLACAILTQVRRSRRLGYITGLE
mgnify:CR=1 FL=1